jgi:hypothetical protein
MQSVSSNEVVFGGGLVVGPKQVVSESWYTVDVREWSHVTYICLPPWMSRC